MNNLLMNVFNTGKVCTYYNLRFLREKTGFTLLELILALTILSMVALIIGSGFRLGIKAWEKGESEARETQRLRALSGLISQNVKSAYPYNMKIEQEKVVVFEGDANSLLFVTSFVEPRGGGFKWVRYSYSEGSLVFTEGKLPDKNFLDKIAENEEVIDSDIGEVTFEYLSSFEEEWQESWDLGEGIPVAVRVKIAYFQPFFITLPMGLVDSGKKI
jgi:general secretion pathway protein J